MIRKHLARKIRSKGRPKVGEGVGHMDIWMRVFQIERVTCAKALRHKGTLRVKSKKAAIIGTVNKGESSR